MIQGERTVRWRVTYQDRITPSHVWVWDEEDEEQARTRYARALETDASRHVTLQRMVWAPVEVEMLAQTTPKIAPSLKRGAPRDPHEAPPHA